MKYLIKDNKTYLIEVDKKKIKEIKDIIVSKYVRQAIYSNENAELYISRRYLVCSGFNVPIDSYNGDSFFYYNIYPDILHVINDLLNDNLVVINKLMNLDSKEIVENRKLNYYYYQLKNLINYTEVHNIILCHNDSVMEYDENLKFNSYSKNPIKRLIKKNLLVKNDKRI